MARVTVVGAGYVGVCTALALVRAGHTTVLVDIDARRVDDLRAGRVPFHEPGVPKALRAARRSDRLDATTDLEVAVRRSRFVFLCVGTPQSADGSIDLSQIKKASSAVGQALQGRRDFPVVVVKSTVVPGTSERTVSPAVERASGLVAGKTVGIASNPEFLREGSALADALKPDRIVVGASDQRTTLAVRALYSKQRSRVIATTPATAEMIKYAANAFLAMKIAYANEMANLCAVLGIDWYDVVPGLAPDPRIGALFLRAGVGFGGSCFPKDLAALARVAEEQGTPSRLLAATLSVNDTQPHVAVEELTQELGPLAGRRIALLGLAFKPDTDDVRETRALPIWRALLDAGARVVVFDPKATKNFLRLAPEAESAPTLADALKGADGAIVQTEWAEFRRLSPNRIRSLMKTPVVVDGRRTFDRDAMLRAGVRYRAIGLGRPIAPPKSSRRETKAAKPT